METRSEAQPALRALSTKFKKKESTDLMSQQKLINKLFLAQNNKAKLQENFIDDQLDPNYLLIAISSFEQK